MTGRVRPAEPGQMIRQNPGRNRKEKRKRPGKEPGRPFQMVLERKEAELWQE